MLTDAVRGIGGDSDLIGEREPHHGEWGAVLVGLSLKEPGVFLQPGPG